MSVGDRSFCRLFRVPAVPDKRAVERFSELGQGHRLAEVVEADRQTVQYVQVREPVAVELTGDERELLPEVRRSHVVERPVGRQADADPVGRPDGRDPFDHFVQEAIAILNAPADSSVRWFVVDWRKVSMR